MENENGGQADLNVWDSAVPVRVGTRKSELAMIQTRNVIHQIQSIYPDIQCEIVQMTTTGDINLDVPLAEIGDKSLFTKELEQALLKGEVDLVVHSLKDLPTELPKGLTIAAITKREDPRDALVLPLGKGLPQDSNGVELEIINCFPDGCVIGTGSSRRVAAIRSLCPSWEVRGIRGNVNTRLNKLDAPDSPYTATLLAAAGLKRMGLGHRISKILDKDTTLDWPYAVGQGALGLECAESNTKIIALLRQLNHRETYYACVAERALLYTFGGGCSIPLGVRSTFSTIETHEKTEMHSLALEAFHFGSGEAIKEAASISFPDEGSVRNSMAAEMTGIQSISYDGFPLVCKAAAALGLRIGTTLRQRVKETESENQERGAGDVLHWKIKTEDR